jgi:acyl dehydratase
MLKPFDELEVGDEFVSGARTVTETDVMRFAALTGDRGPARGAHGMLLVSYSIGLVPNDRVVALRRLREVAFERPVNPGDTIRVVGRIVELGAMSPEVGMVTGRWRIVNQDAETVADLEIDALWSNA